MKVIKTLLLISAICLFIQNPSALAQHGEAVDDAEALREIPLGETPCATYTQPDQHQYLYHKWAVQYLHLKAPHKDPYGRIYKNIYIDPITNDHMTLTGYLLFLDPYCKAHPGDTYNQALDAMTADLKRIQALREKDAIEHPVTEDPATIGKPAQASEKTQADGAVKDHVDGGASDGIAAPTQIVAPVAAPATSAPIKSKAEASK